MASVNDLTRRWEVMAQQPDYGQKAANTNRFCQETLRQVARTAWKPVSEPPTEADAQTQCLSPLVLVRWGDGEVTAEEPEDVASGCYPGMKHWARFEDVILKLPEGEGE